MESFGWGVWVLGERDRGKGGSLGTRIVRVERERSRTAKGRKEGPVKPLQTRSKKIHGGKKLKAGLDFAKGN